MSACRSCEAPVVWAKTEAGKNMPMDETPVEGDEKFWQARDPDRPLNGLFSLVRGVARRATDEDRRLRRPLYTSHFATCPQADNWRGAKR